MHKNQHFSQTLRLAAPVALSQVSDMLTVTADTIMVGMLGTTALAAVTLANSISIVVMLFAIGYTIAITPLAAREWGGKNHGAFFAIIKRGFHVSMLITTLLVVLLLLGSPFMHLTGSPTEVCEQAIPFFRWIVLSFLLRIAFGSFKQASEATGNSHTPMMIALFANIVNVFLNWVFIWGKLGMPELGAEGAGVATFLSRVVACAIAWIAWQQLKRRNPHTYQPLPNHVTQKLFRSGTVIGSQIVLEVLAFASGAIMMGWISTTALAAHQVALNLASISFMIALGLGSAATVRISNFLGEHKPTEAMKAGWTTIQLVVGYELFSALLYVLGRTLFPTFYTVDLEVIQLASYLLLFAAIFQLVDGVQAVALGVLRGLHDHNVPTLIAGVSYLAVALPTSYVVAFVFKVGPGGIWIGYVAGLIVAAVGYLLRIRYIQHRLLAAS